MKLLSQHPNILQRRLRNVHVATNLSDFLVYFLVGNLNKWVTENE